MARGSRRRALLASTVTTITSIGAGMIMYGVLGPFLGLKVVIPLIAPAQLVAVAVTLAGCSGIICNGAWRPCFSLAWCPAFSPAPCCSSSSPKTALRRIIGVCLLAFAAYETWRGNDRRPQRHPALLPLGGLAAGALLGSIGIAGPLLAVIFLRYGLLKEDLIAMVALFFLLGNAQRTVLYWQQGFFVADRLALAAGMGLAMLAGVYAGRRVLPHVSLKLFRRLVLGMLVLFGLQFLFW